MNTNPFSMLLLLLMPLGVFAEAESPKPNIIIVMPDDLAYGDYGCLGNPVLQTPSVDAFMKESLLFTNFHVSPTCAPTRAALMSGRHEFKNGVTHAILERERMSLDTFTLPEMLKTAGYTTGIFGKWHLGDEKAYRPESRGKAEWADRLLVHHAGRWKNGTAEQSKYVKSAIQNSRFTLVNYVELYDLEADPGETTNVINQHPKVARDLSAAYDQWW